MGMAAEPRGRGGRSRARKEEEEERERRSLKGEKARLWRGKGKDAWAVEKSQSKYGELKEERSNVQNGELREFPVGRGPPPRLRVIESASTFFDDVRVENAGGVVGSVDDGGNKNLVPAKRGGDGWRVVW
ncbi:hypothetical protein Droror1_Dr00027662 [Drosera rotundifolia]